MSNKELIHLSYDHPILFYDGICNLCNGFVQLLIKKDKKKIFRYASLQSESVSAIMRQVNPYETQINSVILLYKGKFYIRSNVSFLIARIIGFPWSIFVVFKILPRSFRDLIYAWIARNRYKWFGKRESCELPRESLKELFLNGKN